MIPHVCVSCVFKQGGSLVCKSDGSVKSFPFKVNGMDVPGNTAVSGDSSEKSNPPLPKSLS